MKAINFFSSIGEHGRNPHQMAKTYLGLRSNMDDCLNRLKLYQHSHEYFLEKNTRRFDLFTPLGAICCMSLLIPAAIIDFPLMIREMVENTEVKYCREDRISLSVKVYNECKNILDELKKNPFDETKIFWALNRLLLLDDRSLEARTNGMAESKTLKPLYIETLLALVDELANKCEYIFSSQCQDTRKCLTNLFRKIPITYIHNRQIKEWKITFNPEDEKNLEINSRQKILPLEISTEESQVLNHRSCLP